MKRETRIRRKRENAGEERGSPFSPPLNSRFPHNIVSRGTHDSLNAEEWIQGKPCRVTFDSGASGTVARPDIVAGQPERKPSTAYVFQMAPGETNPAMKEALAQVTLWRRAVGVHRRSYIRFHPVISCSVGLRRIRPRTSSATTGSVGGDIIEPWRLIKFFPELTGRLRGDACSM